MFILSFAIFLDNRLFLKTLGYLFSYLWEYFTCFKNY